MRRSLPPSQAAALLALLALTALGNDGGQGDCQPGQVWGYQTAAANSRMSDKTPTAITHSDGACITLSTADSKEGGKGTATFHYKDGDVVVPIDGFETDKKAASDLLAPITGDPTEPPPLLVKSETTRKRFVGQAGPQCGAIEVPPPDEEIPTPIATTDPGRTPAAQGSSKPGSSPTEFPQDPATTQVPSSSGNGAVFSGPNTNVWNTMISASSISNTARGTEIVEAATAARLTLLSAATDDQATLSAPYRNLSAEQLPGYLQRAQDALAQAADALEAAKGGLEQSERARFHNYYLNARDKAELGKQMMQDALAANASGDPGLESQLLNLSKLRNWNPLARNEDMASLFGKQLDAAAASSTDGLVNRLLMLNGLPADQKAAALKKLKLLGSVNLQLEGSQTLTLDMPHNGYLLGAAARGAVDCSSFVSSILPAGVRAGRFTTLDFRSMWIYARTQKFPAPPKYAKDRAQLVKATASAFKPVDLYAGETLAVGDLLVYRLRDEPIGHVVIVRGYNALTKRAEIIEAAQSAGTVQERTLNLSSDPIGAKRRLLMPGLWALRLRPVSNQACYYRDQGRVPAQDHAPSQPHHRGVAQ